MGPGEDKKYREITVVGMKNETADFGKYELEEVGREFKSTASSTEKKYILPKTVGGTKVHLLLGVKNTHIQPVLILRSRSIFESFQRCGGFKNYICWAE